MLSKKEINRYSRQINLPDFGIEGQESLKRAKVLIIGVGGLGCPVLQYLSAAGIGAITIIDGDVVSESNLQRQILFLEEDIGKSKAQVAASRATKINPFVSVNFIDDYLTVQKAIEIFNDYDLIIDCCDNFGTRYLINDVCVHFGKPFISAALFRYEGQLSIYNVLMDNNVYSSNLRQVFPLDHEKNTSQNCNEAGVLSTLPGIIGLYQANEVVKFFTDRKNCLINKLWCVNCKDLSHLIIDTATDKTSPVKSIREIESTTYSVPCKSKSGNLDRTALLSFVSDEKSVIVDVRELHESPRMEKIAHLEIPLPELNQHSEKLCQYTKVLFVCKSGVRSKTAARWTKENCPEIQSYAYYAGVSELMEELNPS